MYNNELIKKFNDYIIIHEQNQKLMAQIVKNAEPLIQDVSDEDKLRAAYALNMCTVSVSQIVDYADVNVLEQEYEAILNNINLEQMPKDEALLHIIRQLLDTITYFRIEEGEKAMVEKEYQQQMKNAIWNAVPNFGMIVAGGNPITMAISLASQIGIGYMNYRRTKAEKNLEHERKLWELQKTAIEQFNALRRELFDTAWRLADTYDFPDKYRLTERQISQYNKILMDHDYLRKYERLESIQDKFEAYPPFWYFIGNAANYIAGDKDLNLSDETRKRYREKALLYFKKFENLNKYNILREDQLVSSCALEHIDLLLLNPDFNKDEVLNLLKIAENSSGNANDILELCSIAYLRIGEKDEASRILRILVNEDYNKIINAQLLSSIYVDRLNRIDYELLATRVDSDYLYPMPQAGESLDALQAEFGKKQRDVLKLKYKRVIEAYLDKYSVEWNKLTSIFDIDKEYPIAFFLDNDSARAERKKEVRKLYADVNKKESYQQRIAESNYELNILEILNELSRCVFSSEAFADIRLQEAFENIVRGNIIANRNEINLLQTAMTKGDFSMTAYLMSQTISLRTIVGRAFDLLLDNAFKQVDASNVNDITFLEGNLRAFCDANGLQMPEIMVNKSEKTSGTFDDSKDAFDPKLFGPQAVMAKKNADFLNDMCVLVKDKIEKAKLTDSDTAIFYRDTPEFNGYFFNSSFNGHADVKSHSIMVLQDKTKRKHDLIFTTDGIVSIINNSLKCLTPYSEVELKGDAILLYRNELLLKREYKVKSFDINMLYALIRQLGTKFVKNLDDKIEYIEETATPALLNQWFKESEFNNDSSITKIYAIPSKEILTHLGYCLDEEFDPDKNLLQFFYDTKSGEILEFRIVQFNNINSNFQGLLLENEGILKVK